MSSSFLFNHSPYSIYSKDTATELSLTTFGRAVQGLAPEGQAGGTITVNHNGQSIELEILDSHRN